MEKERQGVNLGKKGPAFEKSREKRHFLQKVGGKGQPMPKSELLLAKKSSSTSVLLYIRTSLVATFHHLEKEKETLCRKDTNPPANFQHG